MRFSLPSRAKLMSMKKYGLFMVLNCCALLSFAQEQPADAAGKKLVPKDVHIIIDVMSDNWLNSPDSIKNKVLKSRGVNVYAMYDIPVGSSGFSFAAGAGINSYNVSNNAAVSYISDSMNKVTTAFGPLSGSYKNNKLSVSYLDIPIELRYKTPADRSGGCFKFALEGKAGYLFNSHTKYVTTASRTKTYDIINLTQYRYGVGLRIGYEWFALTGFYSLSPLFEKDKGPGVIPFSVGISINPY